MRWAAALLALVPVHALAACPEVTAPVISLSFESRYTADDPSRSEIDIEAEADAKAALAPLDAFISALTQQTDQALSEGDRAGAACVADALSQWARADALAELGSQTAQLTVGSRLAALALVAAQVLAAAPPEDTAVVQAWLQRRMAEQMTFWETAPSGAAAGNLRAWAALAGASVSLVTGDAVTRGWAAWSLSYVACTAQADGSLPQEMRRKHLALRYQLHAVAPLVVGAALLNRQGVSVTGTCDRALDRIVAFTLRDVAKGGAESAAITGEAQTIDGGWSELDDFQLSWAEAWLTLSADAELASRLEPLRPLRYSKLGGDQTRIWGP